MRHLTDVAHLTNYTFWPMEKTIHILNCVKDYNILHITNSELPHIDGGPKVGLQLTLIFYIYLIFMHIFTYIMLTY